jgi:D-threo-aldose 1-dehydrogenase
MSFETRQIGKTGVQVTSASFGCASIGNLYRESTDSDAMDVLATAWDAGIRYFDTAPHYGRGRSEQRLGTFLLDKQRDGMVISTKVGRVLSPGAQQVELDGFIDPLPNDVRYDYTGDGIEESLEGSRTRLGTKYIDIVYVHDIGTYTHGAANADHMEEFLGSGYERLIRLKERGEIAAIGLGVNENEICIEIMQAHPLDAILLAGRLTLLDRSAEETLVPMCRAAGTSLVLGGVFNSGILATGPVAGATYDYAPASPEILKVVEILQAKAAANGLPLAEAALQFARSHPQSASVLIGTAKSSTLLKNLRGFR